eukprot:3275165-Prymnesium_polylepis.2
MSAVAGHIVSAARRPAHTQKPTARARRESGCGRGACSAAPRGRRTTTCAADKCPPPPPPVPTRPGAGQLRGGGRAAALCADAVWALRRGAAASRARARPHGADWLPRLPRAALAAHGQRAGVAACLDRAGAAPCGPLDQSIALHRMIIPPWPWTE